jgi:hypothetical protein
MCLSASADTLQIHFEGLDIHYDGSRIYDVNGTPPNSGGGTGIPSKADPLVTMSFFADDTLLGTLTQNIYADLLIEGVNNIPQGGGTVVSAGNGGNFGFDLLMNAGVPAWGLALNIDTMEISFTPLGNLAVVLGGGLAAGNPLVVAQNLPAFVNGFLDKNEDITITFSCSNVRNITAANGYITGFDGAGTGNITGTYVPEPSEYLMGVLGVLGLAYFASRRKPAMVS